MNWTECNLARHSRASKSREVLLRQKQHFAKARAALRNANVKISSPPSISFLAQPAQSSSVQHHPSRPRISASSSSQKRARDNSLGKVRHYFQPDDGLNLPSVGDLQKDQVEGETLRQKRRKLLLKGDWTGINLQKPIEMEFSRPRPFLGGPWAHSKLHHAKSASRTRHMLGIKHHAGHISALETMVQTMRPAAPSQLRVRVGSRERVFGGSFNVSPRSRTCRDVESSPCVSLNPGSSSNERQPQRMHQDKVSAPKAGRQFPKLVELHQPIPHRPFLPSLFRSQSSDSDDATSTKARVGVLNPDVPTSREDENETWWNFVGVVEHSPFASDNETSGNQSIAMPKDISPGVSHNSLSKTIDVPDREFESVQAQRAVNAEFNMVAGPPAQRQEGLWHFHEPQAIIGEVSRDNGISLTADDADFSSPGSSPPRLQQKSKTHEDMVVKTQPGLSDNSDEVSLLALPTSCSPTSEEILAQFHDYANLRDSSDDAIIPSILLKPYQLENSQELLKLPTQLQDVATDQVQLPQPHNINDVENYIWRKFVFTQSDDNFQKAFEKARKETARDLRPSDPSTNIDEDETRNATHLDPEPSEMTAALSNSPNDAVSGFDDQHEASPTDMSIDISSMAPVSHKATNGGSSPDPLSAPNPAWSDMIMQTDEAMSGCSSASKDAGLVDDFLKRSGAWSLITGGQDNASLAAQPSSASAQNEADEALRFARPKPFMGRKIHINEQRQLALSASQIRGRGVTRRRQKRIGDGRASIRNLPNFSSDPIEEVEDAVSTKRAQKLSLFGSLDTEEE